MFDNLREQASSTPFFEEEAQFQPAAGTLVPARRRAGRFLGMTAPQRFFLAVLLMTAVCALGTMCMLMTGRFGLY